MTKRNFGILFCLMITSFAYSQTEVKPIDKAEICVNYALQCPLYSVNLISDLALSQDTRYRSRIGASLNYFFKRRWYTGYSIAYSQEGGSHHALPTNADYLKHTFKTGFSTLHSRRLIFTLYGGIDLNLLISAKYINSYTGEKENVSALYNRFHISYPIGLGLKTKLPGHFFVSFHSFISISPYSVSDVSSIDAAQFIFPAFQISLSKFLNKRP